MVKKKVKILWVAGFLIIMYICLIRNKFCAQGAELNTEVSVQQEDNWIDGERVATENNDVPIENTAETANTKDALVSMIVTELDLGAYQSKMIVGETQLLTVTAIPTSVTDCVYTFTSSDTGVATINGLGRITAQKVGTTTITAACGSVTGSFMLTVEEEPTEEIIPVMDVEIADYEDELAVGKTRILSATVVPSNASNAQLSFRSSDSSIATVTSTGEIKGISKGNVIIYCSAGFVTKEVPITVKVDTAKIEMNSSYMVLRPGNSFSLEATVTPSDAEQQVSYQSSKPEIATVSSEGIVTAKKCGSTSIIVSNGDSSVAVSVIVNQNEGKEQMMEEEEIVEVESIVYPLQTSTVNTPVVTQDMLKYYYEKKEILSVQGEGYLLKINGNQIQNYANELVTRIEFQEEEEGVSFILNEGRTLCGPVMLLLEDAQGCYLYLYNESKKKYEIIETENMSELTITTAGKYLITEKSITIPEWNICVITGTGTVIVILLVLYVGIKKKYWFW